MRRARRDVATGLAIGLIERIAQIVKKPPATDTSVAVKIAGDVIELDMSGAP